MIDIYHVMQYITLFGACYVSKN